MANYYIVGGGPSARPYLPGLARVFEHGRTVHVYAVNDAALYLKCTRAVSICAAWTSKRGQFVRELGRPLWLAKHCRDVAPWDANYFDSYIHTTCSGNAALRMALAESCPDSDTIYLLGFDMEGGYWYPEYPWKRPDEFTDPAKFIRFRAELGDIAGTAKTRVVHVGARESPFLISRPDL